MKAFVLALAISVFMGAVAFAQGWQAVDPDADRSKVNIKDLDSCEKAGVYFYNQSSQCPDFETAEENLKSSIKMLAYSLDERVKGRHDRHHINFCRWSLMRAYFEYGRLLQHRSSEAEVMFHRGEKEAETLLKENEVLDDSNKVYVSFAAYCLTEIRGYQGRWAEAIEFADVAWHGGWRQWNESLVKQLYKEMAKQNISGVYLPKPIQGACLSGVLCFPLNVVPDMVGELVMQTGRQVGWTFKAWGQGRGKAGLKAMCWIPIRPFTGVVTGIADAFRGYPFWNTKTVRQIGDREFEF